MGEGVASPTTGRPALIVRPYAGETAWYPGPVTTRRPGRSPRTGNGDGVDTARAAAVGER
ncbi:hypothetical protein Sme01_71090 [Sphaerisporangium melleum]|uniref:Uncharacterized protein n=1 Tax=Sphaerisporangium melleum TaxID=321316 RepID=A0A917RPU9_9ACTN|nr:hypothetical protein GCM10007964_68640 [Sphaerisporangium melleum]GII74633.1 hypothetical protein Sme01_71090 [Sphaerisporangium melleum]